MCPVFVSPRIHCFLSISVQRACYLARFARNDNAVVTTTDETYYVIIVSRKYKYCRRKTSEELELHGGLKEAVHLDLNGIKVAKNTNFEAKNTNTGQKCQFPA